MRLPKNWNMLDNGAELVVVTRNAAPGDISVQIGVDPTYITWNRGGKVTKSEYSNPDKWDLQRIAAYYAREAEDQIKRARREEAISTPAQYGMVLGLPPYFEFKLDELRTRIILKALDSLHHDTYAELVSYPKDKEALEEMIENFREILGVKIPDNVIPFEPR